jgi:hypothetical protein
MKNVLTTVATLACMSASVANAGAWTPAVDIEVAYAHGAYGGYGMYQISDTSVNPSNCSDVWYVLSKQDNPVFSEIYSLMLVAYTSGKKVRLYIAGCSPHNHPEIQHVKMVD